MAPDALAAHTPPAAARVGEPPGAPPRARALLARPWAIALAVAIPLAAIYLAVEPPSGDLAAATYRSDQFARVGLTLWDNGWYGGHYLPGYSLLAPALGALLGNRVLLALCTVGAAGVFGLIAQRTFTAEGGARIAAGSFALGASVTMLSGRVAFGLGLLVGLLAVVALQRGRVPIALALAVLTSLASPVAGAFLALAALAYALTRGARRGLAVAAAALAPILALTLAFPEGGWEPFAPSLFWPGLAGVALIALMLPRLAGDLSPRAGGGLSPGAGGGLSPGAARTLAWGAWLYAVALIGAYALRTPVGGNAARLGALFAAPLLAGALWEHPRPTGARAPGSRAYARLRHPLVMLALALALLYWQLETPLNDVSELAGDPSVHASYYVPLLGELERRAHGGPLRVEVPMMGSHWESAYLAEHGSILLARGWERQLDTRYGARFYEGPPLNAAAYRAWLYENAVAYVALPDVRLDYSAAAEGRLIAQGLPYLRAVWRGAHWRLFAVVGAPPLAARPAVLTGVGADSFTLAVPHPGSYVVRVRFTPYWALQRGSGCVRAAPGGWTVVDARAAGAIRVGIAFSLARVFDHGPRCTPGA